MRAPTEQFVRELRDEAKRHRLRARDLQRALIRTTLATASGCDPSTIPERIIETLTVDASCRVHGVDQAIRNLAS